jgi:DNA-binding Lrp family transcriptional regulator
VVSQVVALTEEEKQKLIERWKSMVRPPVDHLYLQQGCNHHGTHRAQENPKHRVDEQFLLLKQIAKQPFLHISQRAKTLGWSADKMLNFIQKLESAGLILRVDVRLGEKGRPAQLLELSAKALELLKAQGVAPKPLHGGLLHAFWIDRLSQTYRKAGYAVEDNTLLSETYQPDLVCLKGKEQLIVEVVVSPQNIEHLRRQIEEALVHGFKVIVATYPKELAEALANKLSEFENILVVGAPELWRSVQLLNSDV